MKLRDDHFLMSLVKGGDKEAYNELVKKYRVSAISFAYSFLLDAYAAEDAVQDVFVNIYLKRDRYQPKGAFKTFLYQAIRNKCLDQLRRRRLRTAVDLDIVAGDIRGGSVEEDFFKTEDTRRLFALMQDLKADYKTALYLFAIEGAGYAETAQIMRKTQAQVKILIYRARKKLKSRYREVTADEN